MERDKSRLRNELKYLINHHDYMILKKRIEYVLKPDPFSLKTGGYHVRSLYFDDIFNTSLNDKLSGINEREKLRIRIYNKCSDILKLERKSKLGHFILKDSIPITQSQYYDIITGNIDFLMEPHTPLMQYLYNRMRTNLLKPSVIVDYMREAYIYPLENIRITFDSELRTCINSRDIFDESISTIDAVENCQKILEIKFNNFLPDFIRNMLQFASRERMAISKYAICRRYI